MSFSCMFKVSAKNLSERSLFKSLYICRGLLRGSLFLLYHTSERFTGFFYMFSRSLYKCISLFSFVEVSCLGLFSYCITPVRGLQVFFYMFSRSLYKCISLFSFVEVSCMSLFS